ncbi:DUF6610 family protein [Natrinema pallidum]|uniref:DUF6610 family protein n=1 Tax=Natrinema pallidum TaxID=69527 RepID=UPI003750CEE1
MAFSSTESQPAASSGAAVRADYVAFLHRYPFALDAFRLGFATGVREDYRLRQHMHDAIDVPVIVLDNDFRDPDLERLRDRVREYEPEIVVIGDAYDAGDAETLLEAADDLQSEFAVEPIVVPKSRSALEAIAVDADVIVGYPNAGSYGDVHAREFSSAGDWVGRDVHILGGSPPRQWDVIRELTGAVDPAEHGLDAFLERDRREDVANIRGLDWNGLHKVAYKGQHWHHSKPHWRDADELTIRETIDKGLRNIRHYWRERGVWPRETPQEHYTAVLAPRTADDAVCTGCGRDLLDPEDVDQLVQYADGWTRSYCSQRCRDHAEYHCDFEAIVDQSGEYLW